MDTQQIGQVRAFNRLITRQVGALEESFLQRGRPLAEARLLFEIGPHGAELRALRAKLGLDSGYLSRLLKSLETQGLVALAPLGADRRRRAVRLTPAGESELGLYNRLSDDHAGALLAALDPTRQARLLAAMGEVEKLVRAASVTLAPEDPDSEEARACLDAYFRELALRFEAGFDPALNAPLDTVDMRPPRGALILARLDGRVVGCGAVTDMGHAIGEVRRMWTAPDIRGLGVAHRVLRAIESFAQEAGLQTLRLETNRALKEAQALYRRAGFREVPPFNDEHYADHWFEKAL